MGKARVEGIVVATVTPFNEEGKVDTGAIKSLCDYYVEAGVDGLYVNGSTGEFPTMSLEEKTKAAEAYVKSTDNRIPIIMHVGSARVDEAVTLAQHAKSLGVEGISAVSPYYFKYDEKAQLEYFSTLARVNPDLPFYVYNFPACTGNDMTPALLKKIVDNNNNIVGVKDTSHNYLKFTKFLNAMGQDFICLMGSDAMILAALFMGGRGAVTATAASFPDPLVKMYQAYKNQNYDEARRLQFLVARLVESIASTPFLASRKVALQLRGFNYPSVKPPLRDMEPEEVENFKSQIKKIEEDYSFDLTSNIT